MTARFSLWEDIKIQSQYFPHAVSFFHFILDFSFRSTRHYLAVKIFEWVFIFLQLLQVWPRTQNCCTYTSKPLTAPDKRGAKSTEEKNVMPNLGAKNPWASRVFLHQDYLVQISSSVFKSSDTWVPEMSSYLTTILTLVYRWDTENTGHFQA